MKNGTKRIELRLNDEKRRKIKVGDKIKFIKYPSFDDELIVEVVDLLKYNSFEELINNYDISLFADKSITKEELLNILKKFYTKADEKKYGVLGIKIKLDK